MASAQSGRCAIRAMSETSVQLNQLLVGAGFLALTTEQSEKLDAYLHLLLRWNAKINLTAIRNEDEIFSRHFVESIVCAHYLPAGIQNLLDFGSGAGFPGVPIAICRPDLAITLAESQNKKAAFLAEVVRQLQLKAKVFSGRAEAIEGQFGCVTLRAVDRMERAVAAGTARVAPAGCLAALTTLREAPTIQHAAGPAFEWLQPQTLPGSERRVLLLGSRQA